MKKTQEKYKQRELIKELKKVKDKKGITLIALVVTIVILLILSGVTINMLLGEKGIIRTAQEAKNTWEGAVANEQESIQNLVNELNSIMNDDGGDTGTDPVDITTVTDTNHETIKAKDNLGNIVTVPKGFKVVTSEGTTVPEGIVIEDANQNQFVWIPVGTVYKDATGTNTSTIQLGRYTFDTSNGTPTLVQAAYTDENPTNYKSIVGIATSNFEFQELATYQEGIESGGMDALNETAKDLAGFVESVKNNGGYYLARYEASYGSGSSTADWKPLSKVSTANGSSINYVEGTLWNGSVTQLKASKICRNMYANDNTVGVESDLINSYAWDTAIVFIQEMGHSNYANKTDGNGTLKNTGETGDEVCNIYDMAANLVEWTTEYSTVTSTFAYPCTHRGGYYDSSGICAARRYHFPSFGGSNYVGFRPLLYIK